MSKLMSILNKVGFILTATLCWVLFMLFGETLSALGAGDEAKLYYVSSFASLAFLILICVIVFKLVKFDKASNIIDFIKINFVKLLLVSSPMPIMFCYLGWCIEIFNIGFGAAKIFGFDEAVTGILFNASTIIVGIGCILALSPKLKFFKCAVKKLFKI